MHYKIHKRKLAVCVCLLLLISTIFSFTTQGQITYAASNNKPPVVVASERIPKQTIALGQTKVIDLSKLFYDADGDTLTYSVVSTPVGIVTTTVNGNQLTIEGLAPGNTRIKVTADDGKLGRAMSSFEVEGLLYSNSSPEVAQALTNQTLVVNSADSTFDISNVFTDADNDVLTFSAVSDNTGIATVSLTGTTLSVSPNEVGTATITLTASDGNGGIISTTFTVTVIAASSNHAPIVATTIKNQRGNKNGPNWNVDLQDVFSDEDQDVLTFSASSSNGAIATAASNGGTTLSLTPKEVGTSTITVTADDGNGGQASTSFTVTVTAPMIFISDFVQGGEGRDVIELFNPNPVEAPVGYEIVIHQYNPITGTRNVERVEVFSSYIAYYVAINEIFYDFFDITNAQYYNSEYHATSGSTIVAIALECNGQIVDLLGDPTATTALLPNNGGFKRHNRFQSGSSIFESSEWGQLSPGDYSSIRANF
ncbi:Ig-like domain-containing protein [Lysinibacillus sp. NPDC097195]|uniref:Ig-like domain-containing protein n=1 Tax=Lysinibacillus sp. NPDC097195 TaxID=3364141 RepID=UPI0037F4BF53